MELAVKGILVVDWPCLAQLFEESVVTNTKRTKKTEDIIASWEGTTTQ